MCLNEWGFKPTSGRKKKKEKRKNTSKGQGEPEVEDWKGGEGKFYRTNSVSRKKFLLPLRERRFKSISEIYKMLNNCLSIITSKEEDFNSQKLAIKRLRNRIFLIKITST